MTGFERLEHSLIDVIKEEQAKLGYQKEDIRFYYPISSLGHFFETEATPEEMQKLLADFPEYTKERLGEVQISHKGERFCFHVPEEGVAYVHDHMDKNEFIKELVELVGRHDCTMQEIEDLFRKEDWDAQMEPVDNGEFDCLMYFKNKPDDRYYYCFKDEGCHIIYHRFLPEDYHDFGF